MNQDERLNQDELLGVAAEAARAVGARLRKAFRSRPEVDTKRDFHDPVTEHDRAAEQTIRAVVSERLPGSAFVGEEGGTTGSGELVWYVDPIDGTANFAAGLPFFCVSIAAAWRGELVAGVIYDPVREDEFTATRAGAWCNGTPLRSSGAARDREALLLTSYPTPRDLEVGAGGGAGSGPAAAPDSGPDSGSGPGSGEDAVLRRYARLLRSFATVRRPGSAALNLAHVAAGWADVAYMTAVSPWDVAAGALLVRSAGGVFLGDPLRPGDFLAHVAGFDLAGSAIAGLPPDTPG